MSSTNGEGASSSADDKPCPAHTLESLYGKPLVGDLNAALAPPGWAPSNEQLHGNLFELSDEELAAVAEFSQRVDLLIRQALGTPETDGTTASSSAADDANKAAAKGGDKAAEKDRKKAEKKKQEDEARRAKEFEGLPPFVGLPMSYAENLANRRMVLLTKFCIARNFDVVMTEHMFRISTDFRLKNNFDGVPQFPAEASVRGWDQAELTEFQGVGPREPGRITTMREQVRTHSQNGWHKWDKEGRPLLYERIGKVDPPKLYERIQAMVQPGADPSDRSYEMHQHVSEIGGQLLRFQNQKWMKEKGKPVVQVSAIFDCEGVTMGHLHDQMMSLLKRDSEEDKRVYPEGLHNVYVINAPGFVRIFWAVVRLWLDERQLKKVHFFKPGEETVKGLSAVIDEENLPECMGGKCVCEGGCFQEMLPADHPFLRDRTYDLTIAARSKVIVETAVVDVKAGQEVFFEYTVVEHNLSVRVLFDTTPPKPASIEGDAADATKETSKKEAKKDEKKDELPPGCTVVTEEGKQAKGQGTFVAPADGAVKMEFDNSHSMLRGKRVLYRAYVEKPVL